MTGVLLGVPFLWHGGGFLPGSGSAHCKVHCLPAAERVQCQEEGHSRRPGVDLAWHCPFPFLAPPGAASPSPASSLPGASPWGLSLVRLCQGPLPHGRPPGDQHAAGPFSINESSRVWSPLSPSPRPPCPVGAHHRPATKRASCRKENRKLIAQLSRRRTSPLGLGIDLFACEPPRGSLRCIAAAMGRSAGRRRRHVLLSLVAIGLARFALGEESSTCAPLGGETALVDGVVSKLCAPRRGPRCDGTSA